MKIRVTKFKILTLVFFAVLMVWFLGTNQIIEMNNYAGMKSLVFNPAATIVSFLFISSLITLYLYCDESLPHGILISILTFYSVIWVFVFYSISGLTSPWLLTIGGLINITPLLLVFLSSKYFKINFGLLNIKNGLFKIRIEIIVTTIIIVVSVFMYKKMGVSFNFIDSYERRLIARNDVKGVLAYTYMMSINGLAPLLAFLSVYNKRFIYLILAFGFVILSFGFTGSKAPFAFTFLMTLLAFYFVHGYKNIIYVLIMIMTILVSLGFLEYHIFDFSWIADIYVRRAILIVPQIQMYYLDYMFTNNMYDYNILIGNEGSLPVTFLIGKLYMGNVETNANSITFITELGRRGLLGYSINVIFLILYFNFLTYMYRITTHKVWLAISTLYALLLLEQSFSTAFLSSGLGLITTLLILFRYKQK